jgi:hypothetical protein
VFKVVYVSLLVLMTQNCGAQLQFELSSLQPLSLIHSVSFAGRAEGVEEGTAADADVQVSGAAGVGGFSLSGQKFLPPFAAPLQGLTEQQPVQPSQQT